MHHSSGFRLSDSDLIGLRESALGRQPAAASLDPFWEYLRSHGEHLSDFPGSGFIFGTVLVYLENEHGIDLTKSRHDELRDFLSATREAACFFLTAEHRATYQDELNGTIFDRDRLNAYYNDFNETGETHAGHAMAAAIDALKVALSAVTPGSAVLVHIG